MEKDYKPSHQNQHIKSSTKFFFKWPKKVSFSYNFQGYFAHTQKWVTSQSFCLTGSPPYLSRQILSINDHKNVKVVLKADRRVIFRTWLFCWRMKKKKMASLTFNHDKTNSNFLLDQLPSCQQQQASTVVLKIWKKMCAHLLLEFE